jgi:dTMP kinase
LFAAARADHVARTIRPAVERGQWVLSDRFLDSSIAYQGGAGKLGADAIRSLHAFGSHGFLPDRTLLLELAPEAARARASRRDGGAGDRIGSRSAAYHTDVAAAFRAIAGAEPERVRRVDAGGTADQVTERLMAALRDFL